VNVIVEKLVRTDVYWQGLAHSLDCIAAPLSALLPSSSYRRVNIIATKADEVHVSRVTRRKGEHVKRRHA
jgi:hypothetical protein